MDPLQAFLEDLKRQKLADNMFLGLIHILIGRRITREDGTLISSGMTWRECAAVLKKARWKKDMVQELGLDLGDLAPRDRERFWYMAISRAKVSSEKAKKVADHLAEELKQKGYIVGKAPGEKEITEAE